MGVRPSPRRPLRAALSGLVLASLVLAGFAAAATESGSSSASSSVALPPSGLASLVSAVNSSGSFAERAGYSAETVSTVLAPRPALGTLEVVVTFQPANASLFESPSAGAPPLTIGEIAKEFGLSEASYDAAVQFFLARGLTVVHTWPDRLSLSVAGPAALVGAAFGTTIFDGTYQGRSVTFPSSPPSLPEPLEEEVASVVGLSSGFDTFTVPALAPPPEASAGASPSQGGANEITPAIARSIYELSALYNVTSSPTYSTSHGIALLLWGPGYDPNDLTTFYQQSYPGAFPQPTLDPDPVDGAPSPSPSALSDPCSEEAKELTLDLEWSGSMAPGATLYSVYAPEEGGSGAQECEPTSASMADALHAAIGLPVSAISMSFGVSESGDAALRSAFDTYMLEAVQMGITVLAATGDTGGDATPPPGCTGGLNPEYPASSPDALAVGGTSVTLNRNLLGTITGFSESAWNDSGGGFSTQFSAPFWQSVTGNSYRGMPDVSATAGDNYVYFDNGPTMAGGTSFASPLWAGLITEMGSVYGKPFGLIAPRLYSIGGAEPSGKVAVGLADVTSGSTCLGTAGPGWDPETGWGTPRALALYEDLTATFVTLSVGVSPSAIGPGGSVTISAHLANETSGVPIPGVPVLVSLSSSTDLGPCTGTFGSASPVTDAQGNVSISISVPSCYLGSHATASVEVVSDGYYGTNSTSVPVNLLAFVPFLDGITEFPYNVVGFAVIIAVAVAVGYVLGRPRGGAPPSNVLTAPPVPPAAPPASPVPSNLPPAPPPSPAVPSTDSTAPQAPTDSDAPSAPQKP